MSASIHSPPRPWIPGILCWKHDGEDHGYNELFNGKVGTECAGMRHQQDGEKSGSAGKIMASKAKKMIGIDRPQMRTLRFQDV